MNIPDNLKFNDERPAVVQIHNNDKTNVIAIGLKKDQVLKKHVTPFPALLVVLKGAITFEMEGTATELPVYSTFGIPANVPHEVTGVEESIFLVMKEKG